MSIQIQVINVKASINNAHSFLDSISKRLVNQPECNYYKLAALELVANKIGEIKCDESGLINLDLGDLLKSIIEKLDQCEHLPVYVDIIYMMNIQRDFLMEVAEEWIKTQKQTCKSKVTYSVHSREEEDGIYYDVIYPTPNAYTILESYKDKTKSDRLAGLLNELME